MKDKLAIPVQSQEFWKFTQQIRIIFKSLSQAGLEIAKKLLENRARK